MSDVAKFKNLAIQVASFEGYNEIFYYSTMIPDVDPSAERGDIGNASLRGHQIVQPWLIVESLQETQRRGEPL
jgi:hypothetical protein